MRFLGVVVSDDLSDDLSWSANTTAVSKKAQQRLHFLRVLKRNNLEERLLVTFYRATIESILAYGITIWYAGCTAADRRVLSRVIHSAQRIIGCLLPSLEDLAYPRYLSRASNIIKDKFHPGNHLFQLLPSGRRYRSQRTRTNRFRDSFFPRAIMAVNNKKNVLI
uniref:Alkylated DNA repair protein AlkB homologue 8 N-terminal domain-containing protein n=1 Tax=Nothobranchius furzeri TaxID=105023 RepID=A0A1A8UVY9_NOTFU